jgi:hypothetical protein
MKLLKAERFKIHLTFTGKIQQRNNSYKTSNLINNGDCSHFFSDAESRKSQDTSEKSTHKINDFNTC